MKKTQRDIIVQPEDCKMMDLMVKAGFSKLHPGGRYSTEKLLDSLKIDQSKRIIDIGCGPGETTIYIAKKYGCHVTGVDIMPEMIRKAKENAVKHKVSHLTKFETVDVMAPFYSEHLYDIAIIQAVLIFGDKQRMLNFAFSALKDKGLIGAIELTWGNNPSQTIKETFSRELAKPLINVGTKGDWISSIDEAGFKKASCSEIQAMNISSFIKMWVGEQWRNKINIVYQCLTSREVLQRMVTIINLFKKYPDYLKYGFYLAQK